MKANFRNIILFFFLSAVTAGWSITAETVPSNQGESAVLADLVVNGTVYGPVEFTLDSNNAPLLPAATVRSLFTGYVKPDLLASAVSGDGPVSAEDLLRAGIHSSFEPDALVLTVNIEPRSRLATEIALGRNKVRKSSAENRLRNEPFSLITGLSLGYSPRYSMNSEGPVYSARSDLVLSPSLNIYGAVVEGASTITYDTAFSHSLDAARLVLDFPSAESRFTAGVVQNKPVSFQAPANLVGLTLSRESLFSNRRSGSRPAFGEIVIERKADVSVDVNGVSVKRMMLLPGTYRLSDLPLSSGLNDVTVRIAEEGLLPRTLRLGIPFDGDILPPGAVDYATAFGYDRDSLSRPFGSAFFSVGVLPSLELGFDLSGSADSFLGGITTLGASPVGTFGLGAALSLPGDFGAALVSPVPAVRSFWRFSASGHRYIPRVGLSAEYRARGFVAPQEDSLPLNGGVPAIDPSWLFSGQISQSLPGSAGSIGLVCNTDVIDSEFTGVSAQAGYYVSFPGPVSLSVNAGGDWKTESGLDWRLSVAVSITPPGRPSVQYRHDVFEQSNSVDVAHGFDPEGKAGISAHYSDVYGASSMRTAGIRGRIDTGKADLSTAIMYSRYDAMGTEDIDGRIAASTNLAYAGGYFALGTARSDSFAILVPSRDLAGQPVALRSADGSQTISKKGNLTAVTGLVPYRPYSAAVELPESGANSTTVPLSVELLPTYKSVSVVKVCPAPSISAKGIAIDTDGRVMSGLSGELINLDGLAVAEKGTFTDEGGSFECYGLEKGNYAIRWSDGSTTVFSIPESSPFTLVDLGKISAEMPASGKGSTK